MRQTYEKILYLEIISLGLSIILGFIALFNPSKFLIIFAFYLLALSLACDAYARQFTSYRQLQGQKQIIRAVILGFLVTVLIFYL